MENKLIYASEATCFEEALPLGNGSLGTTVYGKCDKEKIALNHDTLWSGKPRLVKNDKAKEAFSESRRLALDGRLREATDLLERDFTSIWSNSYMPLGNLYAQFPQGEVRDYYRELDMQRGVVLVRYRQNDIRFEREYFVSHPDNCLVMHITSSRPADVAFSADSPLKSTSYAAERTLYLTGECPSSVAPRYAKDSVPTVYDGEGVKFAAVARVVTDGDCDFDQGTLRVFGATDTTVVLCVETSYIDFDTLPAKPYLAPCEEALQETAEKPYPLLLADHIADHSALYTRVELDLGFETPRKTTDQRIRGADSDLGMVELIYNFGRYLVIAASREGSEATNLQGIWNEHFYAPWSSNYTVNINTEMNYWPVLMNNLTGLDMPICDLLRKISVTGAAAAKEFYGAKGYCAHHNVDLWGHATPVGNHRCGCIGYAFWNMSAGWLCRHLWEHYEYTLDRDFLRDTAYPLMEGAAKFYLDIMVRDGDRYIITPTTSPENGYKHPVEGDLALAKSCTMTQAILMDLFSNILKAAAVLHVEDDFINRVRDVLPHLDPYAIGSEGQLLEYNDDFEEQDVHHRHISHLYGLYPGESITTQSTPALADACRVTLERRGDISTGWAMGWRVCLWAKLKDGDRVLSLIKNQLTFVDPHAAINYGCGGTYPNLLDAHPPFQIDGNYGVCAGITLMLLQCEDEKIRLLPALPSELKNGSVKGLKAKGDITVDMVWRDGNLTQYSLLSPVDCTVTVATAAGDTAVTLYAGVRKTCIG
ncbi:MAG: glycoside hydrolase family 95 protein [Ruminococcaceae bacterium]|nr:glycoside hydrolase family 95 protein [Oscillospiraceae bacterium]